jgi:hypothetical protein
MIITGKWKINVQNKSRVTASREGPLKILRNFSK